MADDPTPWADRGIWVAVSAGIVATVSGVAIWIRNVNKSVNAVPVIEQRLSAADTDRSEMRKELKQAISKQAEMATDIAVIASHIRSQGAGE